MQSEGTNESAPVKPENFSYPDYRPDLHLLILGLLLAVVITAGGWLYYRHLATEARRTTQESLSAVADLKAQELSNWMNERLGDAEVARASVVVGGVAVNPNSAEVRRAAIIRVKIFCDIYKYAAVLIADSRGRVQMQYPDNYALSDASIAEHIKQALHSRKVVVSDLTRDRPGDPVLMWLSCPVFARQQTNGPPDGAVLMVVDPAKFLYPTIQTWPTPSKSAETLIVEREGDDVVFLNQLRFRTNSALNLRLPINSNPDLPSVKALRGVQGIIEGRDYRGVPVLAATRWIPNTPWLMIAKVDQDEIFAPLRQQALDICVITGLLLLATILGISLAWRQQKLLNARFNEARFRALIEQAPVAVSITRNAKTIYVNQKYLRQYGFQSVEELVGRSAASQWAPEFRELILDRARRRQQGEGVPSEYEGVGQRKDGSQFPVHVAVGVVQLPDGPATLAFLTDVTAREQAEAAVHESEQKYRGIVEQSPLGIFQSSVEGRLISVNQALAAMFGYDTPEQMVSDNEAIATQRFARSEQWREVVRAASESSASIQCEVEYRRQDGTIFPAHLYLRAVRAGDGTIQLLEGFIEDISARKRAMEQIEMLKFSIDKHFDAAYWMDTDSRFVYVNDTACKTLGYTREELLGQPLTTIAPNATPHLLEEVWKRLRKTGFFTRESVHHRKDGGEIPVEIVASYVRFEGKEFNCGFARDITERKRSQDELIWKTALLEAQVDSTLDGILVVDTKGKKILQNQRFLDFFKVPEQIAFDSDDAKLLRHVTSQMKQPQKFKERVAFLYEHRDEIGRDELELADGTILDRYSSPVRDKAGKHYGRIWTFRDITEQRKLEEQFRQAQKMEAVGQLAGGVAHDYNNILAASMIQLGMLLSEPDLAPDLRATLESLKRGADRAANLTRQLLVFSRRQAMQMKQVELNALLEDEIKMLRRLLGENMELSIQAQKGHAWIEADAGMIEQVIMNLCINARDAMPDGGRLTVGVSPLELTKDAPLPHADARAGKFYCLSVRDSGCGMSPETMRQIFEPFFTTKEVGKGTGLGLATVYGIVKQHQGWVEVSSEVGKGTEFRVLLPAAAKVSAAAIFDLGGGFSGGTESVLIVEDEETVREALVNCLRSAGYQVHAANTGPAALRDWRDKISAVDLLITDMIIPGGMNGLELAEAFKAFKPELPVIIMSGYSKDLLKSGIPTERGYVFQSKPCDPATLTALVRKSLSQVPYRPGPSSAELGR
jgi:PAS domain S-box-containing protein